MQASQISSQEVRTRSMIEVRRLNMNKPHSDATTTRQTPYDYCIILEWTNLCVGLHQLLRIYLRVRPGVTVSRLYHYNIILAPFVSTRVRTCVHRCVYVRARERTCVRVCGRIRVRECARVGLRVCMCVCRPT